MSPLSMYCDYLMSPLSMHCGYLMSPLSMYYGYLRLHFSMYFDYIRSPQLSMSCCFPRSHLLSEVFLYARRDVSYYGMASSFRTDIPPSVRPLEFACPGHIFNIVSNSSLKLCMQHNLGWRSVATKVGSRGPSFLELWPLFIFLAFAGPYFKHCFMYQPQTIHANISWYWPFVCIHVYILEYCRHCCKNYFNTLLRSWSQRSRPPSWKSIFRILN